VEGGKRESGRKTSELNTVSSLSCCLFNGQSIKAKSKLHELKIMLKSANCSIYCVTETWLDDTVTDCMLCDGTDFSVVRRDRQRREGGGVCIFVRKNLQTIQPKFAKKFSAIEFVCIDVKQSKQQIRFACVYRPPNSNTAEYSALLCELVSLLCAVNYPVHVTGDFNFPGINWSASTADNKFSRDFVDCTLQNGMSQFVTEPTRGANVLDLVLSNVQQGVYDMSVQMPFLTSDHNMLFFSVNSCDQPVNVSKFYRDFRGADYDLINGFLLSIDWNLLFSTCESDVQNYWDIFHGILTSVIESVVPLKCQKLRKFKMPKTVQKLKNKRKKLYKQKRKAEYKAATVEYKNALEDMFQEQEIRVLNSGDVNGLYRFVNRNLKCKNDILPLKNDRGNIVVTDVEKAQLLNDNFGSVYTEDNGVLPVFPRVVSENVYKCDVTLSEDAVLRVLRKLPNKASHTPDGLPALFLKRIAESVSEPLAKIFQLSFETSKLPRVWLTADVCPIFKKNDPSVPLNYRPISLTCVSCKVMETVVRNELVQYFAVNKLISNAQHGFQAKKSVCTQLLECQSDWFEMLRNALGVDIIYIDFQKAFDTVCHSKLLHKLSAFGICGKLLLWLEAFLSDRIQRVRINDVLSESIAVRSSVPQGSILGPTLFLVYVNDIIDCVADVPSVKLKLFADDVKLYATVENAEVLQTVLTRVSEWSQKWQLTIANSKCCVLGLGAKNQERVYWLDGATVSRESNCRDLGVQLSSSNKSSQHCSIVAAKAMRRAGMILRAFSTNNSETLLKAYTVYVRPLLECATPTWCPYLLKDIDAIERVQRFFTRMVLKRCRLSALPYPERLSLMGIESLELRRIRTDLIMYFKIIRGHCVIDRSDIFQLSVHDRIQKNDFKIDVPFCRTVCLQNTFSVRRANLWNRLPNSVVSSTSVNMFVGKLLSVDLAKYCRRGRL